MPTDTDGDEQSADSDADIYAVVTDDGAINRSVKERPALPQFHDTVDLPALVENESYSYWVVGRTRPSFSQHGYEVWAPLAESSPSTNHNDSRLHINPNDLIANGHENTNPHLEELFIVERSQIEQTYSAGTVRQMLGNRSEQLSYRDTGSAVSLRDDGETPVRSQHPSSLGQGHGWVHGTDPEQNTVHEIFVPMEDLQIRIDRGCFLVEWTNDAVYRTTASSRRDLIDRQDGLFCKNLMTVPEEVVPDRPEDEHNTVEPDAVAYHEHSADMTNTP